MTDVENRCPVDHGKISTTAPGSVIPIPGLRDRFGIATALNTKRNGLLHLVEQLWRQHGDVSELHIANRRVVILAHPDHIARVNMEPMGKYIKGSSYDTLRKYLGDALVTSVGPTWKKQRQSLAPFFTPKAVARDYGPLFMQDVAWFAERWSSDSGAEPVDMLPEMATLTSSILLKTLFSTVGREVISQLKGAVEVMMRYMSGRSTSDRFRLPDWFPTAASKEYAAARSRVDEFILGVIAERRRMLAADRPADLLTRMINNEEETAATDIDDRGLRDQCVNMFIAGYETTARTLSFVWYLLDKHPAVAAELHAEIDALPADLSVEDLDDAPYSLCVIKEALRLYPPAPIYLRDLAEDDRIGNHVVQAGSIIILAPYLTHRHPDFWTDPLKFDPGRWAGNAERDMHPYAFHPFSGGPRVCIGRSFAYLESQILLVTLARAFAPEVAAGYEPVWRMRSVLGPENGMPMTIRRRHK